MDNYKLSEWLEAKREAAASDNLLGPIMAPMFADLRERALALESVNADSLEALEAIVQLKSDSWAEDPLFWTLDDAVEVAKQAIERAK